MKLALCSSFVPFVDGGYRNIVEWLAAMLVRAGHEVETIWVPEVDTPSLLVQQMAAYRWIDLDAADRVICFRPQSHLIRHRHKIVWFIHHLRVFYDLWESEYRSFPDDLAHRSLRDILHDTDTRALKEARTVFANSRVVAERLRQHNGVDACVLYPPVFEPERFRRGETGNTIVCVCRIERHKRQHLLVDAMTHCRSGVKLALYGASSDPVYVDALRQTIETHGLHDRVSLHDTWISEDAKVAALENALAVAYVPYDEDSYGYPVIEGAHAGKAVISTTDAGGVLEFVRDGVEGRISEPTAEGLSAVFDALYEDRDATGRMGAAATGRITELGLDWAHVLERLLA
ncbi:glycosyltransferase family 4 protein [Luteibacter sp. PPL552]